MKLIKRNNNKIRLVQVENPVFKNQFGGQLINVKCYHQPARDRDCFAYIYSRLKEEIYLKEKIYQTK